jgi:glycosyltransferase involved in cell wall biosynthesis
VTAAGPRVSVIVPVHNGERFIADSVLSVLHQTRPVHECLVVDDGSTDGTMDVLRSFDGDVRVIRQPHAGVAAARNAGMREASGDHFAFLDADDVWLSHKVDRQLSMMAGAGPEAAAYSGYLIGDEHLRSRRLVLHCCTQRSLDDALLIEGPGLGFSFTGMTTRAAAERVGGFDERLSTSADLDFAWRLAGRCRVVGVREALAIHRLHGKSQMHRDIARLERDMGVVLDAALAAGLPVRTVQRGRTNLQTYAGLRLLLDGAVRPGLARLSRAALPDPRRPLRMTVAAATRRVSQHRAALGVPLDIRRPPPDLGVASDPRAAGSAACYPSTVA